MAKNQHDRQPSQDDGAILVGAFLLFFGMIFYLVWTMFHKQISMFYSWVRMVEFYPMYLVGKLINNPYSEWFIFFRDSDAQKIQFMHLVISSAWFALPIALTLVPYLCRRMYRHRRRTNPINELHFAKEKDYTLDSMGSELSHIYPHLTLFKMINLIPRSIHEGKYRMVETEKQFAINNQLVDQITEDSWHVNRSRAVKIFASQIGQPWQGVENLTKWEYAIIAVLLPRLAARDAKMPQAAFDAAKKLSAKLMDHYWRQSVATYNKEKDLLDIDITAAKEAFDIYFKHPLVQQVIKRHAYTSTIIYDMLGTARQIGICQPAEFRWLRVVDRRLWILVDTVGRHKPFSEIAGVHSHYLHEIRFKRPLLKPHVDSAATGLSKEFDSVKLSEEELLVLEAQQKNKKNLPGITETFAVKKSERRGETIFFGFRTTGVDPLQDDLMEVSITDKQEKPLQKLSLLILRRQLTQDQITNMGLSQKELQQRSGKLSQEAAKEKIKSIAIGNKLVVWSSNWTTQWIPGIQIASDELIDAYDLFSKTKIFASGLAKKNAGKSESDHVSHLTRHEIVNLLSIRTKMTSQVPKDAVELQQNETNFPINSKDECLLLMAMLSYYDAEQSESNASKALINQGTIY